MNTTIMLSIDKASGKLQARYRDGAHPVFKDVESESDLHALVQERAAIWNVTTEDVTVLCSSTVDFPEEYTKDATTIALCRSLKS